MVTHSLLNDSKCNDVTGCRKILTARGGNRTGPQDLKANTLTRRCKSRLLPQGSRSVLYIPLPTTYFPALNRFVPESAQSFAVILGHSILMPETQAADPHWPPNVTGQEWSFGMTNTKLEYRQYMLEL